MTLPSYNKLVSAEKELSQTQIVDSIMRNAPDLSEKIQSLRDEGINDRNILESIKERQKRSPEADLAVSIPGAAITGLAAAPRNLVETARGLGEFVQDPVTGFGNVLRNIFGQEPAPPRETFAELVYGKERAQELKEQFGFQKAEDLIKEVIGIAVPIAGPLGDIILENAPTRESAQEFLQEKLGLDVTAQTPLGRVAESFVGGTAENIFFGPGAAALGGGEAGGQIVRELGGPEPLAKGVELVAPLLSFKKPSKSRVKQISQQEITNSKIANLEKKLTPLKAVGEEIQVKPLRERGVEPVKPINATEIVEETRNAQVNESLKALDPVERTRGEALTVINEGISEQFTRARGATSNFYDRVKQRVANQTIPMTKTMRGMHDFIEELPKTGIPQSARNSITRFLEEQIALFDETGRIPVQDAISMKQRFNNFADFEFPDLGAKSKFKNSVNPVRKQAVGELNNGIRQLDKEAFLDFRKAERSHQNDANRFGKDVVVKIQRAEDPIKVIGEVTSPAEFKALKDALQVKGSDAFSPSMLTLEKLALEEVGLGKITPESSRKLADIKRNLSPRGNDVANFIEESRKPLSPQSRTALLQEGIVKDIARASEIGGDLTKTVSIGKTPEGLRLIRETLKGTDALKVVEQAIVDDILTPVFFTKGEFSSKAVRDLFKNKQAIQVIEMIEGKPYLNRLRSLENEANAVKKAFNRFENETKQLEQRAKTKAERKSESLKAQDAEKNQTARLFRDPVRFLKENPAFLHGASLLNWLGVPVAPVAGSFAAVQIAKRLMPKLLAKKEFFNNLKVIKKNPNAFRNGMLELSQEIRDAISENTEEQVN
ncbi:MAG: hypothetical protein ABFQ95_01120 [Pseudomonadota bacterium]